MADGTRKNIEDIDAGDEVRATDPKTGRTEAKKVTVVHRNIDTDMTDVTIKTADGRRSVLHTTAEHPFWNSTHKAWVNAGDLRSDDVLHTSDGRPAVVAEVRAYGSSRVMYNLTVVDIHTYFVLAGNTPILVHNTEPDDCIPGYENPGHHDPNGGPNPYNPNKGVLPSDAAEQFQNSVLVDGVRWTKIGSGKKAVYYRYSNDGHGNWHWSGASNGVNSRGNPVEIPLEHVPIQVRRR
ncbi:polymorphic toxin-type HINT domain-containing protein [Nonomuraea rubra]